MRSWLPKVAAMIWWKNAHRDLQGDRHRAAVLPQTNQGFACCHRTYLVSDPRACTFANGGIRIRFFPDQVRNFGVGFYASYEYVRGLRRSNNFPPQFWRRSTSDAATWIPIPSLAAKRRRPSKKDCWSWRRQRSAQGRYGSATVQTQRCWSTSRPRRQPRLGSRAKFSTSNFPRFSNVGKDTWTGGLDFRPMRFNALTCSQVKLMVGLKSAIPISVCTTFRPASAFRKAMSSMS
jgi:hypothetical protein